MLVTYPALFYQEEGRHIAEFPDLEGCQTFGGTISETIELAREALGAYLASRYDNKLSVNSPSDIKTLSCPSDAFLSYITCDINKYGSKSKAVKKTLTIPKWLNDEAEKNNINFSGVLSDALKERLGL